MHDMWRRISIVVTVFFGFVGASLAQAQNDIAQTNQAQNDIARTEVQSDSQIGVKVRLSEFTMQRGYTLTAGDMRLGIQPETFTSAAPVWLHTKKTYPDVPEYLKPVSDIYVYQIDIPGAGYNPTPLWLSYDYETTPESRRQFYYYDGNQASWVALPTTIDSVTQQARAAWHFSYSIIGLFDDTRYGLGPSQSASFVPFGDIQSGGAIAIDVATGQVLYEKDAHTKRSIASLTKLMTAYVLLEQNIDWDRQVTYHQRYDQIGAWLSLREGDVVTMRNLLYSLLVGSTNNAAYALVDQIGMTPETFVALMNQSAVELGLSETMFADPSGLNPHNQSTPADYAKFMNIVMRDPRMLDMTTLGRYEFTTINTGQYHGFNNTNVLLRSSDLYITGSKTGYLDEAMYCLALKAKDGDNEVITVVLGSPSSSGRFFESERLMKWAFTNYDW